MAHRPAPGAPAAQLGGDPSALAAQIVADARALGFHRVGIVPVAPAARHDAYRAWLAAGYAGEMTYLATPEHVAARRDARFLLSGARTLVVCALSYAAPEPALPPGGPRGKIARYARGADYHLVLKEKLARLADCVAVAVGRPVAARACVDTAPLLERDEAERAGLGFVAKNTLLIAPGLGSYVVLGELLLDVAVAATGDEPVRKKCGGCRSCLDACPTGAFVDAFVLDARRCISYLTIENTGAIPRALREAVGTMIFGCDICQEVCPFNAAVDAGHGSSVPAPELAPAPGARAFPELLALLELGAAQFKRFTKRSALRRLHRVQLLRNVCVALGNARDVAAIPALRHALDREPPLVRAHAAWALGRLGDRDGLAGALAIERDAAVREEIEAALGG